MLSFCFILCSYCLAQYLCYNEIIYFCNDDICYVDPVLLIIWKFETTLHLLAFRQNMGRHSLWRRLPYFLIDFHHKEIIFFNHSASYNASRWKDLDLHSQGDPPYTLVVFSFCDVKLAKKEKLSLEMTSTHTFHLWCACALAYLQSWHYCISSQHGSPEDGYDDGIISGRPFHSLTTGYECIHVGW